MFYRIIFLVLFIHFNQSLVAQKNFVKASILLVSGDTLIGFVNNKEWRQNPSSIDFKTNLESSSITYSATKIKALLLNEGKIQYITSCIRIDKTPIDAQQISKIDERLIIEESTFLRVLIQGQLSLFYYYDFKPHYFIRKGNEDLLEIVIQLNLVTNNQGNESIKTFDKYKLQLSAAMSDCVSLKEKIAKTTFNEKSLKALVLEYNRCQSSAITFVETPTKIKADLGLIVGGNFTTLRFSGDADPIVKGKFSNSFTINGGLFLNLVLPGNQGQWAIRNEIFYKSINSQSSYQTNVAGRVTRYNNVINYEALKYNLGAQWKAPSNKVQPFANLGVALAVPIKSNSYRDIISIGSPSYTDREDYPKNSLEFGYWVSAGVVVRRINLQLRYDVAGRAGWGNRIGYAPNVNSFFLLVSYRLNSRSNK
jgi:hypothetical protein